MTDREELLQELTQAPDTVVKALLTLLHQPTAASQPRPEQKSSMPLLQFIDQLNSQGSDSEHDPLPKDFARNLDHYLSGGSQHQK